VITRQDFQRGSDRRRWIAGIHSFDPVSGHAIIKVAEGNVAFGESDVTYMYSWREWDLLRNQEVRRLRACDAPLRNMRWHPNLDHFTGHRWRVLFAYRASPARRQ